jgi:RNA polymerase sigma-70 factor (ECF subfamily)
MLDTPAESNEDSKSDKILCPSDECRRQVYRLAYHLLGNPDDAEDACQEVCLRCCRHRGKFRGDAAPPTWLYRVTVNVCKSKLKKRQMCPYVLFADLAEEQAEWLEARLEAGETFEDWLSDEVSRVQQSLAKLPLPSRQLLEWRYGEDLSPAAIAQRLGCRIETVWVRLHRARKALQRAYAALDEEAW